MLNPSTPRIRMPRILCRLICLQLRIQRHFRFLCIHHRDRRDVHDLFHFAPTLRHINVGSASCTGFTARCTFSVSGCGVLPKFENDNIATRGVTLNRRAVSAAHHAISARSSAFGSIFTGQSARKHLSPRFVTNA